MNTRTRILGLVASVVAFCQHGTAADFGFAKRPSLVDTIALDPTGTQSGTGYDLFGANTKVGYDYAFGFAMKVAHSCQISSVEFLVSQREPGVTVNVLIYKGAARNIGNDMYYWTPTWSAPPVATFNLVTSLPKAGDTNFHIFRFEPDSPYTLDADTPYVIVFDPVPTATGEGVYVLANVEKEAGFASGVASPGSEVFMPSYLIRRQTDVRKKFLYNNWTFARTDRRYLTAVLVPEPAQSAVLVGLVLLIGGVLSKHSRIAPRDSVR